MEEPKVARCKVEGREDEKAPRCLFSLVSFVKLAMCTAALSLSSRVAPWQEVSIEDEGQGSLLKHCCNTEQ